VTAATPTQTPAPPATGPDSRLPVPGTEQGRASLYRFGQSVREWEPKPAECRAHRTPLRQSCRSCGLLTINNGSCPGLLPPTAGPEIDLPLCHSELADRRRAVMEIQP